jgi:hypothetical protein
MRAGHGWQCVCNEVNCSHFARCTECRKNRYELEKEGKLQNGKPQKERA